LSHNTSGFSSNLDPAGHALAHEQRLADGAQHLPAVRPRPPGSGELGGGRLDHLEDLAHLAFIAGECDILGERVGDDDKTRRRELAHHDRAARRDLLVALGVDLDCGGFLLHALETAGDARAEPPQHLILLERRKPDQHDHAIAKQHAISGGPDLEGKRRRGNLVAALKAGGVDPFTQQQGTGGKPHGRGDLVSRDGSFGHARAYAMAPFVPTGHRAM
jgi:hypothetical protein